MCNIGGFLIAFLGCLAWGMEGSHATVEFTDCRRSGPPDEGIETECGAQDVLRKTGSRVGQWEKTNSTFRTKNAAGPARSSSKRAVPRSCPCPVLG